MVSKTKTTTTNSTRKTAKKSITPGRISVSRLPDGYEWGNGYETGRNNALDMAHQEFKTLGLFKRLKMALTGNLNLF